MSVPRFGADRDSHSHWENEVADYANDMRDQRRHYHLQRLSVAYDLIDRNGIRSPGHVLDFGCGEGETLVELAHRGFSVSGVDVAPGMIGLSQKRLSDENITPTALVIGSAEALGGIADRSVDILVSLNTLAYLTDAEEHRFFSEAARLVRAGGYLLLSHSNELFDMYALNDGTVDFFRANFLESKTDAPRIAGLLTNSIGTGRPQYNIRANPLTYGAHLAALGFAEVDMAFFNLHPLPPSLLGEGDERRILDHEKITQIPKWKQMFMCSTYFSLSQRTAAAETPEGARSK